MKTHIGNLPFLRFAFEEYDTEKNEFVLTTHIPKLCEKLSQPLGRHELESAISILDSKGVGRVTFEDFKTWYIAKI